MARTVRMFIEKFGKEVLIDEDHELAVAQVAKNKAAAAATGSEEPAAPPVVPPATPAVPPTGVDLSTEKNPEVLRGHLSKLSRPELQALAKQLGIGAGQASAAIVDALVLKLSE